MSRKIRTGLVCLALAFTPTTTLHAEESKGARPQRLDFEDDEVSGEVARGDGSMVGSRGRVKQVSLIRVRTHFLAELVRSADDR